MPLSDTARRILTEAARHPLRLAEPATKLPAAAARAVLNSLLKQGVVEACAAPTGRIGFGWLQPDGATITVRITEAGIAAVGIASAAEDVDADIAVQPHSALLAALEVSVAPAAAADAKAVQQPSTAAPTRANLRDAAQRVLAAWAVPEQPDLANAIATLRAVTPVRTNRQPCQPGAPRQSRQGTNQESVLALLRRPEGATVAQIAEATGWQAHTVRGFFAGLEKRQGIAVEAAERVRQVGPDKQGAKSSYTIYRIAEAG